jgi:hypothetical protein
LSLIVGLFNGFFIIFGNFLHCIKVLGSKVSEGSKVNIATLIGCDSNIGRNNIISGGKWDIIGSCNVLLNLLLEISSSVLI